MYVYNVTLKVDPKVESDWISWMKEKHIPDVMKCGLFQSYKVLILKDSPFADESEGNTYIVQYYFDEMDKYKCYLAEFAPALQQEHLQRYGQSVLGFRTILEEL